MGNEFSSALFSAPDGKEYESNPRYAVIPIPEGVTIEQVQLALQTKPESTVYSIVTNNIQDILTQGDHWAIEEGHSDIETLKEKYETRDKDNNKYSGGQLNTGNLPREYTRRFYVDHIKEDVIKVTYATSTSAAMSRNEAFETVEADAPVSEFNKPF